jgi:biotin transport system substrate-specific component
MKTRRFGTNCTICCITAIGGFLNIPTPLVPFSLQFLFCAYAGVFLGARNALLSQFLYMA